MKFIHLILMVFILAAFTWSPSLQAQTSTTEKTKVEWLSWEEAIELSKKEQKKILLDVYTDWCSWCKKMDTITFNEPRIAVYINENFYPVKLNAHYKDEIKYNDKVYKYQKSGRRGYHELAAEILKGRMSYPTVVFLDEKMEVIQSIIGFKTADQFEVIATYFATDQFMKTPWSSYKATYTSILTDKD